MTFADWLHESMGRIRSDGVQGFRDSVYELWIGALRRADTWAKPGENYYDRDWDVLIILDATRFDTMQSVADSYDFISEVDSIRSPGSATYQWIQRTFTDDYADEMSKTVYISANPFTKNYLSESDFERLEEVWRYAWSDDLNTVPSQSVTDRAIEIAREESPERMIIHYMQPHFPSVPKPIETNRRPPEKWGDDSYWESPWQKQRKGKLDAKTVWESYIANLEYVLDDVELLLENIDADRVVVTSDHGNAKGEWGVYDHPNVPLNCLRKVPWITTAGEDLNSHQPTNHRLREQDNAEKRLKQLGYK